MSDEHDLQALWRKETTEERTIAAADIASSLACHANRQFLAIKLFLWLGLGTLAITLALDMFNIYGYWGGGTIWFVQVVLTLAAAVITIYGISLLNDLEKLKRFDESLVERLCRLRSIFRHRVEIWNFMWATSIPLITFAINSAVDNQNGHFRINKPGLFAAIQITSFAFIYAVTRLSQSPLVSEIKTLIAELEKGDGEGIAALAARRRRWRFWFAILCILLMSLLLWAAWQTWMLAR